MPVFRPQGLSASSRNATDKKIIEQQGEQSSNISNADSVRFTSGTPAFTGYNPVTTQNIPAVLETKSQIADTFATNRREVDKMFATERKPSKEIEDIKNISRKVSPYFRKYQFNYINFSDEDWIEINRKYITTLATFGELEANNWLNGVMQDNVAENQPEIEKYWNGLRGMGASAYGAIVGAWGNLEGATSYLARSAFSKKSPTPENLSWWEGLIDATIDNETTRYGHDVVSTGAYRPERISQIKSLYGGIPDTAIIQTQEQEQQLFNRYTIPEAVQSSGFSTATMLISGAETKLASTVFKGVKGLTTTTKIAKTAKQLERMNTIGKTIDKLENFSYSFTIPMMAGTREGLMEGLSTKLDVMQTSYDELYAIHAKEVQDYAKMLMQNNRDLSLSQAVDIAERQLQSKFNDSKEDIETAASKAGMTNFYINSAINGFTNMTLKAALQAPKVQTALRNGKLTSWAFPKVTPNITGSGSNVTVTPKHPKARAVLSMLKEPTGEFIEEYSQNLSDAYAKGIYNYHITNFLDNKYNGDSSYEIGKHIAGQNAAGLTALGESAVSKEALKAGILGAVSSVIGSVDPRISNYVKKEVRADGSYGYTSQFKKKEGESTFDMISRLTPWRSGAFQGYRDYKERIHAYETEAQVMQDWMRNPENRAKYDGIVGSLAWGKQLDNAATEGDEFGFRNTKLGILVNDSIMLNKLKGTKYYDQYLNNVVTAANAVPGSKEAESILATIKQDANYMSEYENKSDKEILKDVKDNANKILDLMDSAQTEEEAIEKQLGNVSDDVKESLVYAKLAIKDAEDRAPKLESDIKEIASNIKDSRKASSLTDEEKKSLSFIGRAKPYQNFIENTENKIKELKEDVARMNKRKHLNSQEKKDLKSKKAQIKELNKQNKKAKNIISNIDLSKLEGAVLNEKEILSLPVEQRAYMLAPRNKQLFSEAQQRVIDHIIQKGKVQNANFENMIQDSDKLEKLQRQYLEEYNAVLNDPIRLEEYAAIQKQQINDIASKEKFDEINSITDYKEFIDKITKIRETSSMREQSLIFSNLAKQKNEFYERYNNESQKLQNAYGRIIATSNEELSNNEKDNLLSVLTYLSNEGVDINNIKESTEALMAQDENGEYKVIKFIDNINSNLRPSEQITRLSLGDLIQTYKDTMAKINKDNADSKASNTPKKVEDDTPPNTPPKPIEANVKPVEDTKKDKPVKPEQSVDKDTKEEKKKEEKQAEVKVENAKLSTDEDLAKIKEEQAKQEAAQKALDAANTQKPLEETPEQIFENFINNLIGYPDEVRAIALKEFKKLPLDSYDSFEDLYQAISDIANKLADKTTDTNKFKAAKLLRNALYKTKLDYDSRRLEQEKIADRMNNPLLGNQANANSNKIESIDIEGIASKHPDSWIAKYNNQYKIIDYIKSHKFDKSMPVMFVSPSDITEQIKQSIENNNGKYIPLNSMPIIAIVEDVNGPLIYELNGEKKHFQPIAILPATDNSKQSGASRMGAIRKEAFVNDGSNSVKQDQILTTQDGQVITTTINTYPRAEPPGTRNEDVGNAPIEDLISTALDSSEKAEYESSDTTPERKQNLRNKFITWFKQNLKKFTDNNGKNYIALVLDNLKNGNINCRLFTTEMQNYLDPHTGKLLSELLKNKDIAALSANSRMQRATVALSNYIKKFSGDDLSLETNAKGELVFSPSSKTIADKKAEDLARDLGRAFSIPTNYKFELSINQNTQNSDSLILRISLVNKLNNENAIQLLDFIPGETINQETSLTFFNNLIMDGETVRMRGNSQHSFVTWQVKYNEIFNNPSESFKYIKNMINDQILEISKDALSYSVKSVSLNAPFTLDGKSNFTPRQEGSTVKSTKKEITAPQQVSPVEEAGQAPKEVVISSEKPSAEPVVLEPDTGTVIQGKASFQQGDEKPANVKGHFESTMKRFGIRKPKIETKDVYGNDNPKYQWGVWDGWKGSKEEIADQLKSNPNDVITEETWKDYTIAEKEEKLRCLPANL